MTDKRLLLIRHGPTGATEAGVFGADEPLSDPRTVRLVRPLPDWVTGAGPSLRVRISPARRCRQTAAALGLRGQIEPALAEGDFGRWTGKRFDELDPAQTEEWLRDPHATPHGGESLAAMVVRIAGWLDTLPDGPSVAVSHGGAIRAAVVTGLRLPIAAFWRLAVPLLGTVELRGDHGGWSLRL